MTNRVYSVMIVDGGGAGYAKLAKDMNAFSQANFVIQHKTPQAAMDVIWGETRWHAVILDAPEIRDENLEFIAMLKEVSPFMPLICVTDDDDLDKAESAIANGCETVVLRPTVNGVTVPREVALAQARLKAKTERRQSTKFLEMLDEFGKEIEATQHSD